MQCGSNARCVGVRAVVDKCEEGEVDGSRVAVSSRSDEEDKKKSKKIKEKEKKASGRKKKVTGQVVEKK